MSVVRAARAQWRGLPGDVVLGAVGLAAFAIALSAIAGAPEGLSTAPSDARMAFASPLAMMAAVDGAVLAAVYGSFRYTVDRRDGVIAQRLMLESRIDTFLARAVMSTVGGALIALAALVGGRIALAVTVGGLPVDPPAIAATCAMGATGGLWGLALGLVVEHHLVALFAAPLSLSVGVIIGLVWPQVAVWLPLPTMLDAYGFDLGDLGVTASATLGAPLSAGVLSAWVALALTAGAWSLCRRDVR